MNVKLARDVISRSTLRLKGKPCNGGNSENYINAWNRKVYTMIELHGVGLLAEGQSASCWHFEFFLLVTWGEQLHWHFFTFHRNTGFWRKKHHRERNICDTDFFDKGILFSSLTVTLQTNKFLADFSFNYDCEKKRMTIGAFCFRQKYFILVCGRNVN
jgi:hypothetical protein